MKIRSWALLGAVALSVIGGGFAMWTDRTRDEARAGFAVANGRLELKRLDIAAKYPGRIEDVRVSEGQDVVKGQLAAIMDGRDVAARYAAAEAAVQGYGETLARARAERTAHEAEAQLAAIEVARIRRLLKDEAVSRDDLDRAETQQKRASAAVAAADAAMAEAEAARKGARASLAAVSAARDDMVLRAPASGRIEYRLVEPGAVIAAGQKVATLVDPLDVKMVVFLPTRQIARLSLGAEARLRLDGDQPVVVPATVSSIAADSQFTPKSVETAQERDKLMYRVELKLPAALLAAHRQSVHAGMTGEAYIRLDPKADWPPEARQGLVHD